MGKKDNSTDKAMTSYFFCFNNNVELRDGALACTWSSTGGLLEGSIWLIVAQIKAFLILKLVSILLVYFLGS